MQWTDEHGSKWHVRVLDGPYKGNIMLSRRVYSHHRENADAIQSSRFERVFKFMHHAEYYAVTLNEGPQHVRPPADQFLDGME